MAALLSQGPEENGPGTAEARVRPAEFPALPSAIGARGGIAPGSA